MHARGIVTASFCMHAAILLPKFQAKQPTVLVPNTSVFEEDDRAEPDGCLITLQRQA